MKINLYKPDKGIALPKTHPFTGKVGRYTKNLFKALLELCATLFTLLTVFTIHEYGHLQEMQKRKVAIEEFSLGIGPTIYRHRGKEFTISLRAIPIMAYVMPSDEGSKHLDTLSVRDRVIVYAAGIRKNIVAALCILFFLQMLGYQQGKLSKIAFAKTILETPFKIILLYAMFVVQCLSFGAIQQWKKLALSTGGINPPKCVRRFLVYNLGVALLNFMPILPLDGGKIAQDIVAPLVAHYPIVVFLTPFASWIFFFFLWVSFMVPLQFLETENKPA